MSQNTPPPAFAIRKLPVAATVLETYRRVLGKPGLLLRAVAFPLLLSILLASVILVGRAQPTLVTISIILRFLPYALFGVAWHRLTLLGPVAGRPSLLSPWRRRHWRFLGYMVVAALISYGVTAAVTMFAVNVFIRTTGPNDGEMLSALGGGLVVAFLILTYLVTRLSFVFPAVAVDEFYGLADSWSHTKGQSLRLLGVLILVASPFTLLFWAIGRFFGDYLLLGFLAPIKDVETSYEADALSTSAADYFAENFVMFFASECLIVALNYLLLAFIISTISIAFRTCTGWVPAVSTPPAQSGASD